MADDKKSGDAKDKKKGLPAIVLIAAGAVLGGGGVVALVPPKTIEKPVEVPPPAIVEIQHPDILEFTFNPRTEAGKAFANIAFTFTYKVSEDQEQAAFEQIKGNWDLARSAVLTMLRARTSRELNAVNGQHILGDDIKNELDHALFGRNGGHRVATVEMILWNKFMTQ